MSFRVKRQLDPSMDTCLHHVPNIIIIFLKRQFVQYGSRLDEFTQIDEEEGKEGISRFRKENNYYYLVPLVS